MPSSAMARKALFLPLSDSIACLRLPALQKSRSACFHCERMRRWSHALVIITHHDRADMITSRIRVPLATKSPCAQSCARPYGLSTGVAGVAINRLSSRRNGSACYSVVGEPEGHGELAPVRDRCVAFLRRDETPRAARFFHRGFVELRKPAALVHFHVAHLAIRQHIDEQHHGALLAQAARG